MRWKHFSPATMRLGLSVALVAIWVSACTSPANTPLPALPTNTPTLTKPSSPSAVPPTSTPASPTRPATAFDPIQLAWFYKPPVDQDLATLARYFDVFILTRLDEPTRDRLRAQGVRTPFLQYLRFDAIHDPGSCTKSPYHNQVAYNAGDYCALVRDHPDWFLRDAQNNLLLERSGGERYALMDPGNAGWRAFWVQRAQPWQEQYGWDGIFLDNLEASRQRFRLAGRNNLPKNYPDDASFQAAYDGFLRYVVSAYFRPRQRPVFANIVNLDEPAVWFRYLENLDGAMEEGFAVGWKDDYLVVSEWEEQLQRAEETQARGKQIILVAQGTRNDLAREQFAFASFLLISQGRASFRYTNSDTYDEIWLYRDYDQNLGAPLGPRYRVGKNWQRDFSQVTVLVNPTAHTATYTPR